MSSDEEPIGDGDWVSMEVAWGRFYKKMRKTRSFYRPCRRRFKDRFFPYKQLVWKPASFQNTSVRKLYKNKLLEGHTTLNRCILTAKQHINVLALPRKIPYDTHTKVPIEVQTKGVSPRVQHLASPRRIELLHTWLKYQKVLSPMNRDRISAYLADPPTIKDQCTNADPCCRQKRSKPRRSSKHRTMQDLWFQEEVIYFAVVLSAFISKLPLSPLCWRENLISFAICNKLVAAKYIKKNPLHRKDDSYKKELVRVCDKLALFITLVLENVKDKNGDTTSGTSSTELVESDDEVVEEEKSGEGEEIGEDFKDSNKRRLFDVFHELGDSEHPQEVLVYHMKSHLNRNPNKENSSANKNPSFELKDMEEQAREQEKNSEEECSKEETRDTASHLEDLFQASNYTQAAEEDCGLVDSSTWHFVDSNNTDTKYQKLCNIIRTFYQSQGEDETLRVFSQEMLPDVTLPELIDNVQKILSSPPDGDPFVALQHKYYQKLIGYIKLSDPEFLDGDIKDMIRYLSEQLAKQTLENMAIERVDPKTDPENLEYVQTYQNVQQVYYCKENEPDFDAEPCEKQFEYNPDDPWSFKIESRRTSENKQRKPSKVKTDLEPINEDTTSCQTHDCPEVNQKSMNNEPLDINQFKKLHPCTKLSKCEELKLMNVQKTDEQKQIDEEFFAEYMKKWGEKRKKSEEPVDLVQKHTVDLTPHHTGDTVCCASIKAWAKFVTDVTENAKRWCTWIHLKIQEITLHACIIKGEICDFNGKRIQFDREKWFDFIEQLDTDIVRWRHYNQHVHELTEEIVKHFHGKKIECCSLCDDEKITTNGVGMDHLCDSLAEGMKTNEFWRNWLDVMVKETEVLSAITNMNCGLQIEQKLATAIPSYLKFIGSITCIEEGGDYTQSNQKPQKLLRTSNKIRSAPKSVSKSVKNCTKCPPDSVTKSVPKSVEDITRFPPGSKSKLMANENQTKSIMKKKESNESCDILSWNVSEWNIALNNLKLSSCPNLDNVDSIPFETKSKSSCSTFDDTDWSWSGKEMNIFPSDKAQPQIEEAKTPTKIETDLSDSPPAQKKETVSFEDYPSKYFLEKTESPLWQMETVQVTPPPPIVHEECSSTRQNEVEIQQIRTDKGKQELGEMVTQNKPGNKINYSVDELDMDGQKRTQELRQSMEQNKSVKVKEGFKAPQEESVSFTTKDIRKRDYRAQKEYIKMIARKIEKCQKKQELQRESELKNRIQKPEHTDEVLDPDPKPPKEDVNIFHAKILNQLIHPTKKEVESSLEQIAKFCRPLSSTSKMVKAIQDKYRPNTVDANTQSVPELELPHQTHQITETEGVIKTVDHSTSVTNSLLINHEDTRLEQEKTVEDPSKYSVLQRVIDLCQSELIPSKAELRKCKEITKKPAEIDVTQKTRPRSKPAVAQNKIPLRTQPKPNTKTPLLKRRSQLVPTKCSTPKVEQKRTKDKSEAKRPLVRHLTKKSQETLVSGKKLKHKRSQSLPPTSQKSKLKLNPTASIETFLSYDSGLWLTNKANEVPEAIHKVKDTVESTISSIEKCRNAVAKCRLHVNADDLNDKVKEETLTLPRPSLERLTDSNENHLKIELTPHLPNKVCLESVRIWGTFMAELADNAKLWCSWVHSSIKQLKFYSSILKDKSYQISDENIVKLAKWDEFLTKLNKNLSKWKSYSRHVKVLFDHIKATFKNKSIQSDCIKCEKNIELKRLDVNKLILSLTNAMETTLFWRKWIDSMVSEAIVLRDNTNQDFINFLSADSSIDDLRDRTSIPTVTPYSNGMEL